MIEDPLSLIISSEIQKSLFPIKLLFILASLGLGGLTFYLLRHTDWLKHQWGSDLIEFKSFKAFETVGFLKKWERVKTRLKKGWEPEAKLAIIEADQLLDDLLKRMAYTGESLGERLKQLDSTVLPNINKVWEAHQIRNSLIHDPDYKLSLTRAQSALEVYEEAFKCLEAL